MITVPISDKLMRYAEEKAILLAKENVGKNTMNGGKDRDVKGIIGQVAVGLHLREQGWDFILSKPYTENQFGDSYDILFGEDVWDVKCRSWIDDIQKYKSILMTKREQELEKGIDYYVFCTLDRNFKNAYIIGGISYKNLWRFLVPLSNRQQEKMLFDTAGKIYVDKLSPLINIMMHQD